MTSPLERPFLRRNYALGVANGALFHLSAVGLINDAIVLPPFVHHLARQAGVAETWASVMVGLVSALTTVGWLWPQIIFSNIVEPLDRKKPFYVLSGMARIVVYAAAPLGIFFLAASHPLALYWVVACALFLHSSFGGVGLLPFMDIVSKSMPADMRGRFFGARAFWGCLLAFGGAFLVRRLLNPETGPAYPYNYALIFSLGWLAMSSAILLFCMAQEPPGRPRQVKITLGQQLRRAPRLPRRDRDFRRILIVRVLLGLSGIAGPFYVLYATRKMSVGQGAAGIFVACQVLSTALAALAAGRIGDRFGNKVLMTLAAVAGFLAPVSVLCMRVVPFPPSGVLGLSCNVWAFCAVFALGGLAQSCANIAVLNYLLDIAPERRRPTYLGIMYTIAAPLTFAPVLGGALAGWTSYEFVFILAAVFSFLLILSALRLTEPRGKAAAATAAMLDAPLFRPFRWITDKFTAPE